MGFCFFWFHCILTFQLYADLHLHVDGNLYKTVMALVGFSASVVQALTYQNGGLYGVAEHRGATRKIC